MMVWIEIYDLLDFVETVFLYLIVLILENSFRINVLFVKLTSRSYEN